MKVKFLKNIPGSPNGQKVFHYKKNIIYDTDTGQISESLINVFKEMKGVLEDYVSPPEVIKRERKNGNHQEDSKEEDSKEEKKAEIVPSNKAITEAPFNKTKKKVRNNNKKK